jgi:hypothetical protein
VKNLQFLFSMAVVIIAIFFTYSCTNDVTNDNVEDYTVEVRTSGCDGTPMGAPKVTLEPSPPGLCCFTLQFNPVYIPGSPFQVVGLDSLGNSLATKPNGFCTGTLSDPGYTLTCCITQLAASITISLNPSGPGATCVEIDLPCDN